MKVLTEALEQIALGRALLLIWCSLPSLALLGVVAAVGAGGAALIAFAWAPVGAALGAIVLAATISAAYSVSYRNAMAQGAVRDVVAPTAHLLPAAARGAVVGAPIAFVLALATAVSTPARQTPVPPLVLGASWLGCTIALVLLALALPFALRRLALGARIEPALLSGTLHDATASVTLTLRLFAVTAALAVTAIVLGPATLIVALAIAVPLQTFTLDGAVGDQGHHRASLEHELEIVR